MSRHVRLQLYEYAAGELSPPEARQCEEHLALCAACREELREMQEALALIPRRATPPSEERDKGFWRSFAARVEERLPATARPPAFRGVPERIASFVHASRVPLLAGSGALALAAIAAIILLGPHAETVPSPVAEAPAGDSAAVMLHDYLRRSQVLLIGVENARAEEGAPLDFDLERRQSRALVSEARVLREQPLDARSARLVGDLQKIMIQLANTDRRHDAAGVAIVRSGIRQNNLLFKIRMTESVLDAGFAERRSP
ncbi:MAG TPA: zf-HC2 domain-containing protein [Bacteroidota bacterium]|nr:zf-HC2 domain-containing protein [Bacteroidota bacterium]